MNSQEDINYTRIAEALAYIQEHFKEQPDLDKVAAQVHMSPFHFQRMFREWAGVTPKKFLQYISLEHAKSMIRTPHNSLLDVAMETGLSGTSRLYDLFIHIEGMTPGEYKNGGSQLTIKYSFAQSPFGSMLVASTAKGICYMAFAEPEEGIPAALQSHFPNAAFRQVKDPYQEQALSVFAQDWRRPEEIRLHLRGTPFQLKVWQTLLRIPMGHMYTYGKIAEAIEAPRAARAVGSAIGDNPVAFLIPCHRVILSSGNTGQYHWGSIRKTAILGWEAARTNALEHG